MCKLWQYSVFSLQDLWEDYLKSNNNKSNNPKSKSKSQEQKGKGDIFLLWLGVNNMWRSRLNLCRHYKCPGFQVPRINLKPLFHWVKSLSWNWWWSVMGTDWCNTAVFSSFSTIVSGTVSYSSEWAHWLEMPMHSQFRAWGSGNIYVLFHL